MSDDYTYQGKELDVFAAATHWKNYFRGILAPYLKGDVLEVGAGIGGTTVVLHDGSVASWTCLEPDAGLAHQLEKRLVERGLVKRTRVTVGNVTRWRRGSGIIVSSTLTFWSTSGMTARSWRGRADISIRRAR